MLDREKGLEMSDDRSTHQLHLLWRELSVPCHGALYFNPYTGRCVLHTVYSLTSGVAGFPPNNVVCSILYIVTTSFLC